jgi:NAD+ synthase (glutamine-hydrolysing)
VPPGRTFFLPSSAPAPSPRQRYCEELLDALAMGVGDYFEKTKGFRCVGIALSGGRDSLLTLLIAHRWASRAKVPIETFYMPTRFSSEGTQRAAETIAKELGVRFTVLSIDDAFEREMAAAKTMLGPEGALTPITEQNIQARLRAQRMWNWANSSGGLFLQTGNMSEKAVGYTTIGGDLMGALAVISNLPKTVVMYLLDYLLEKHGYEGIKAVIARPAGPELAKGQVGEEELMPFPILDACFHLFAGEKLGPSDVLAAVSALFPEVPAPTLQAYVRKFVRLFTMSIYKWVQSPISLHVGNLDLDRERALQLPVVTQTEW